MASELALPGASDGAGYNDHNNACDYDEYRDGRGNSACEAGGHCYEVLVYGLSFGNARGSCY